MTLDAYVVGPHVVQAFRIDNVRRRRSRSVVLSRSMAFFAADVPLRDASRSRVVIHRMAAIAKGAGRTLSIVRRVKGHPPVGALPDEIRAPDFMGDVPLRR